MKEYDKKDLADEILDDLLGNNEKNESQKKDVVDDVFDNILGGTIKNQNLETYAANTGNLEYFKNTIEDVYRALLKDDAQAIFDTSVEEDYKVEEYTSEKYQSEKETDESDVQFRIDDYIAQKNAKESKEKKEEKEARPGSKLARIIVPPGFGKLKKNKNKKTYDFLKVNKEQKAPNNVNNKAVLNKYNAKRFVTGQMVYEVGMNKIYDELTDVREIIRNTQEDNNSNFFTTAGDPFGAVKTEGSIHYRNMTKALKECIEMIESKVALPSEMHKAFDKLKKAAATYYNERKGIFKKPWTESGKIRLNQAKRIKEIMPILAYSYDIMRNGVSMVNTGYDNKHYSEKSFSDVSNRADTLVAQYELAALKDDFNKGKLKNGDKPEDVFAKMYTRSVYKDKVTKMIEKIDKDICSSYNPSKSSDSYIKGKMDADIKTFARRYVLKKYLDEIHKPDITKKKIKEIEKRITDGSVNKDIDNLAIDPSFVREYKANRKKCFSRYDNIAVINKQCEELKEQFRGIIEQTRETYHGRIETVPVGATIDKETGEPIAVIKKELLSALLFAKVIVLPQAEVCLSKLQAYSPRGEMYRAMVAVADSVINNSKYDLSGEYDIVVNNVGALLNDNEIKTEYIKKIEAIQNPKEIVAESDRKWRESIEKKIEEKQRIVKTSSDSSDSKQIKENDKIRKPAL